MSRTEMAQYLDYCSELLAVTSKLAALHIQAFSDPVVADSVNGILALTLGLPGKIWQKMHLPYTMSPADAAACVKAMKPRIVHPYHYFGSDPTTFADALKGTGIEVRLRDWYAAGQ